MGRPFGSKNKVKKLFCINGHTQSEYSRYERNGGCKECAREKASIWAKEHPEKVKEIYTRFWSVEFNREDYKVRNRTKNWKRSGWTPELFSYTLTFQNNLCAVCDLPFTEEDPPCADHKHTDPPKPRGLLHRTCNSALGLLLDDTKVLERAIKYLKKWQ
jgi:hypothetical protein